MQICKEQNTGAYTIICGMPVYNCLYCHYHNKLCKIKLHNKIENKEIEHSEKVCEKYLNSMVQSVDMTLGFVFYVLIKYKHDNLFDTLKIKYKNNTFTIADYNTLFDFIKIEFSKKAFERRLKRNADILVKKYKWTEYDKYKTLWDAD